MLQEKLKIFNSEHQLFSPESLVLVAISGGVDSVVLAHLLSSIGQNTALAHVNFQLRGEESDADEAFVKAFAQSLNLPFHATHFPTVTIAQSGGDSIQMVARTLRYEWFEQLRVTQNAQHIATAHHLNDSLETTIFNLARGTGIAGLCGIPVRNKYIIRPLLFAEKAEILAYAQTHQLKWREDASNQTNKYSRNLIRNQVLPLLKQINPSIEQTFGQTSQKLRATENLLKAEIGAFVARAIRQNGAIWEIEIDKLLAEAAYIFKLGEWLRGFGFQEAQMIDIAQSLGADSGKQFLSATHILYKDRQYLFLRAQLEETEKKNYLVEKGMEEIALPTGMLYLKELPASEFEIPKTASEIILEADALIYPLKIRHWQQGDWFRPFGMKGKKKVSDFLIDQKIPLHAKEQILVLENGNGDIIWLIGLRADDRFRIGKKAEKLLRLSWGEK